MLQGFYYILHHDVFEFKDFLESWISLNFKKFYLTQEFNEFVEDPFYKMSSLGILFLIAAKDLITALFIAGMIYYFRKASTLDKNEIVTPS